LPPQEVLPSSGGEAICTGVVQGPGGGGGSQAGGPTWNAWAMAGHPSRSQASIRVRKVFRSVCRMGVFNRDIEQGKIKNDGTGPAKSLNRPNSTAKIAKPAGLTVFPPAAKAKAEKQDFDF
jgi:hypothetical protein